MDQQQKIAFIFPGQGAQKVGMGKEFAENFTLARETFEEGDDILGRKLSDLIFDGPDEQLTETKNSQPALFLTSIALLRVLSDQIPDLIPSVCAGLSLGEYTALCASKRLSFSQTLKLVQHRADAMNDACEQTEGTMAVVMGLKSEDVEKVVSNINMPNDLWAANFNCPGQVVISGTPKGIETAAIAMKAAGAKRVLPLNVHGAFHSGLMHSAERSLAPEVNSTDFNDSEIALAMNVSGGYVKELDQIRSELIAQVTSPVRWENSIRAMAADGVTLFVEIGAGKTLAGMNKRIGVTAPTISLNSLADLDRLHEMLQTAVLL